MHIPERYRDRYDRLALSHPWMREMRDEDDRDVRDARIAKLLRQRDEWKARAEAKSAKRAAAVERLRKLPPMDTTGNQFANAMVGPIAFKTAQDISAALIDLLADDGANDDYQPETGVSAAGADANDGKPTANPRQADGMDSRENLGSNLGSGSEVGSEVDSREKLEADVLKFSQVYYASHLLVYDKVIELLDRQDAITASEATRIYENGCEACRAAQKRRIADLGAQVDSLTVRAVAAEQEAEELTAIVDRLTYDRDELQAAYDELTRIAAELCAACGFEMVDAAGEEVRDD